MKHFYTLICLFFITLSSFAQDGYTFGIVHNSDYNFSILATPNFDVTDSDVSDIGFALMLPAGDADVEISSLTTFSGRAWSATQVTEAQFTGAGINSNGRDGFAMNLPPGQTILSHTSGTSFILVSFDISNMPTSGELQILANTDPIAVGLGGAIDSFYNSNIDATTTQNYFNGLILGQEDFSFDTLSIENVQLENTSITVYPNPASDIIHISTTLDVTGLMLFDILGKQVLSSKNTTSIKISHLKIGVYLLQINTTKGNLTKKVVIE